MIGQSISAAFFILARWVSHFAKLSAMGNLLNDGNLPPLLILFLKNEFHIVENTIISVTIQF